MKIIPIVVACLFLSSPAIASAQDDTQPQAGPVANADPSMAQGEDQNDQGDLLVSEADIDEAEPADDGGTAEPEGSSLSKAYGTAKQPAQAGGVSDPVAFVREAYNPAPNAAVGSFNGYSRQPEFSPRLRALFAEDERYANGEIGRLEFNPYTGAQDDDISQVNVTSAEVEGAADRRVVTAVFRNFGSTQTMRFYFERINGRWYIDDIASNGRSGEGPQEPWTLSLILRYGH